MATGPIQLAGHVVFRSIAPFAYANPFNGGLLSWIGNPDNEWDIISYALAAIILGSAVWLIDGTFAFFENRFKTAGLTMLVFVGVMLVLAEGGKFNPMNYKELITVMLFGLAFFSACGRVFSMTEDQKEKDKKKK